MWRHEGISSFHHRKILIQFWPLQVCMRASAVLCVPLLLQCLCGQNRKTAEQEQRATVEGVGRGALGMRVHGKGVRKSRHFSPVAWKSNSLCGTILQESWKAICSTGRLQHPNVVAWGWRYVSWARVRWGEGFLPIVVLLQYDGGGYMTALCCGVLGKLDLTSGIVTFPNSCFWYARGCWKQYLPPIVAVPGGGGESVWLHGLRFWSDLNQTFKMHVNVIIIITATSTGSMLGMAFWGMPHSFLPLALTWRLIRINGQRKKKERK